MLRLACPASASSWSGSGSVGLSSSRRRRVVYSRIRVKARLSKLTLPGLTALVPGGGPIRSGSWFTSRPGWPHHIVPFSGRAARRRP